MNIRLSKADQQLTILNAQDLFGIMSKILKRQGKIRQKQGYYWTIGLEEDQTISFIELLGMQGYDLSYVNGRQIWRIPILKDVPRVILVHSHADGSIKPTTADRTLTKKLIEGAKTVDMEFYDHLIINTKEFYSFRENKDVIR